MEMKIEDKEAIITITSLNSDLKRVIVEPLTKNYKIQKSACDTKYSLELIQKTLEVKGAAYLCDEILRDESPSYVQKNLKHCIHNFLNDDELVEKRILDFGCGCGSSTVILDRIFPRCEIVGVELDKDNLSLAKKRIEFYNLENIKFLLSTDPCSLPKNIGKFDYVILSAVYEHLLLNERKTLLPVIWSHLNPNGILFITETPYRYYHKEFHTTGLSFINYLPDKIAYKYACKFTDRNLSNDTWEDLLRKGVRGGSIKEIINILNKCQDKALLLDPIQPGIKDRIDMAFEKNDSFPIKNYRTNIKYKTLKIIKFLTGVQYVAGLSIAIKKV